MSIKPDDGVDESPATPGRRERLTSRAAAMSAWANDARGTHMTVAVPFRAVERNRRVAASALAGGFAYRLFFWLLPAALIVGGAFGADADSPADAIATGGIPYAAADAVGDAARAAGTPPWVCFVIGAGGLLWAGYTGAKAATLIHALVWDQAPGHARSPLRLSLVFTGLVAAVTGIVVVISALRDATQLVGLLAAVLTLLPLTALWLWVSLELPHDDATWKDLVPGAVFVSLGLAGLYVVTNAFLVENLERSTTLYGAAGATSVLLFWMYLMGRLVVTAPILNTALLHERRERGGAEAAGSTSVAAAARDDDDDAS